MVTANLGILIGLMVLCLGLSWLGSYLIVKGVSKMKKAGELKAFENELMTEIHKEQPKSNTYPVGTPEIRH